MANDSKTKTSFHLIQLKLKNFRCFSELSIDLHPDLTVFVAPNSGGKTAILDAIAIAISPFFRGVGQVPFFKNIGYKSFTILKDDIRLTPIIKDGALISMEQALGASISIRGKTSDTNKTPNKGYQWWNLEKYLLD
ncbi:MAG: AAA family ATPase, partial [Lentisphaerota bacterium]